MIIISEGLSHMRGDDSQAIRWTAKLVLADQRKYLITCFTETNDLKHILELFCLHLSSSPVMN